MNRREFLKKSLEGIVVVSVPLISYCKKKPIKSELSSNSLIKDDIKQELNTNSLIEDGIEYHIQTNKSIYKSGEKVELLYKVTNKSSEELKFVANPIMELIISLKKGERYSKVWDRSWDKEKGIPSQLSPNGSIEINVIWPKLLQQIYRISGVFKHPPKKNIVSVNVYMFPRDSYH